MRRCLLREVHTKLDVFGEGIKEAASQEGQRVPSLDALRETVTPLSGPVVRRK